MNGQSVPAEQDLSNTTKLSDQEPSTLDAGQNHDGAPETFVDAFVGTTFLNYKIVSVIGQGATGTVYKANHLLLEKNFAIKVLHPHLCSDHEALKRFTQEARSASKLQHNGIIAIHDFGVMPDGRPFLSMDYINAGNLSELIGKKPVAPERALRICSLICDALAEAHSKGVIHRDIKPSNVLVLNCGTSEEDIKVVDFGIAKVVADSKHQAITQTGESIGSPPYMSPEQCQARPLDARSDIYSLGCVLYEMLTGAAPFPSDSVYEIIHKHLNSYPESIAKSQPSWANVVELDALVLQALAKDPQRRYQTIGAMKQALATAQKSAYSGYAVTDRAKARYSVFFHRYITKRSALIALLVVSSTLSCAIIYQMLSKSEHRVFWKTAETMENFEVDPTFYALQREGHGDLAKRNWEKAEQTFLAAMESGKWLGQENLSYQDCMNSLPLAQEQLGKTQSAQTLRKRVALLEIFAVDSGNILSNSSKITRLTTTQFTGPKDPKRQEKLLTLLANQSVLYWTERDAANARMCANSALDLAESAQLMAHPEALKALGILTRTSSDNYEFTQAQKDLDRLLKLAQLQPDNSPARANAYDCMGRYYYRHSIYLLDNPSAQQKAANAQRALDWHARARTIWTAVYGNSSPWLADNLVDTGAVLCSQNKFSDAAREIGIACQMDKQIRGMQDPRTGRAYFQYGLTQIKWLEDKPSSEQETARHLQEAGEALKIAETVLQKESTEDAETLLSVSARRGKVFEHLKNYTAAEQHYEKAFTGSLRIDPTSDAAKYAYAGLMRIYKIQNRQHDIDVLMSSVRALDKPAEHK